MYVKIGQKWHEILEIRTDINQETNNFQKYQNKIQTVPKNII